jgi:hypothetical protein
LIPNARAFFSLIVFIAILLSLSRGFVLAPGNAADK